MEQHQPDPHDASNLTDAGLDLNPTDPLKDLKIAYLKRLKRLVLEEARAGKAQIERIWSRPIPARVSMAYCIEDVRVLDCKANGDLLLGCTVNRSRFREGDYLCFNRGDPHGPHAIDVRLMEDRETELLVSPEIKDIPIATVIQEKEGWVLDQGYLDLSYQILSVLNHVGDSVIGRERILPLLMDLEQPKLVTSRIERGLALAEQAGLNWSQQEAMAHAFATDSFYLIQGPPGTGKTRVLAHLAEALVDEGERVLVTAFTHRAINNALNTLSRYAPDTPACKIGDPKRATDLAVDNHPSFSVSPMMEMENGYVIGATPYATCFSRLDGVEFDTVIIDEASQMTLPLAIMAMLAGRKYIFIGDHHQLPPVLVSQPIWEAFQYSVFGDLVDRGFDTMLRETYRLNNDLVSWPNRHFYEGLLTPNEHIAERKVSYQTKPTKFVFPLHPDRRKVFIDLGHRNATTQSSTEARLIADLVETLLMSGFPPEEIGIVTPYRAQARALRSMIRRISSDDGVLKKLIVDTVERMQGQERELIILSLTTSNPTFALDLADFFFQAQRLNVAVTRARSKLIIVGSTHLFEIELDDEEHREAISRLQDLIQSCDYWVPDAER